MDEPRTHFLSASGFAVAEIIVLHAEGQQTPTQARPEEEASDSETASS